MEDDTGLSNEGTKHASPKKKSKAKKKRESSNDDGGTEDASSASPKKKTKSSKKQKASSDEGNAEENTSSSPKKKQKQPKKKQTTRIEEDGLPRDQKALAKLLFNYKFDIPVTLKELSTAIGTNEKTKSWVEEWQAFRRKGIIIPGAEKGTFQLSEEGAKLAANGDEKAMTKPTTNEEYHEYIKDQLKSKYGGPIFDLLLAKSPQTGKELADALNTNKDSHCFFYSFQALKKMAMVEVECLRERKQAFRLSDKAFPMSRPEAKEDDQTDSSKDLKNRIVKEEENGKPEARET